MLKVLETALQEIVEAGLEHEDEYTRVLQMHHDVYDSMGDEDMMLALKL